MSRTPALTYIFLLAAAFVIGLFATIAASQALVSKTTPTRTTVERPAQNNKVQLPLSPAASPLLTVEC